jgi:hypothetical protein
MMCYRLRLFIALLAGVVLAACDSSSTSKTDSAVPLDNHSNGGFSAALPEGLRLNQIAGMGTLLPFLTINCDAGGNVSRRPPTRVDKDEQKIIWESVRVSTGGCTVKIEIEFNDDLFGMVTLANASKRINVTPGSNNVTFSKSEYERPDSDDDGFDNIEELIYCDTNPTDSTITCAHSSKWSGANVRRMQWNKGKWK